MYEFTMVRNVRIVEVSWKRKGDAVYAGIVATLIVDNPWPYRLMKELLDDLNLFLFHNQT